MTALDRHEHQGVAEAPRTARSAKPAATENGVQEEIREMIARAMPGGERTRSSSLYLVPQQRKRILMQALCGKASVESATHDRRVSIAKGVHQKFEIAIGKSHFVVDTDGHFLISDNPHFTNNDAFLAASEELDIALRATAGQNGEPASE